MISRLLYLLPCFLMILRADCFAQSWSQIMTSGQVPELKNHSAVYDAVGHRMLVFGGRTLTGSSSELWSLNLASYSWTKIIPNNSSPAPRYTQNAYFDSVSNRMIIWSGQGTELYNDVWAFNIASNSWQQLWPDGNVSGTPLKRYGTASIFDPVTRNIYTHAGFTTSGRFEDTWTFQTDSMRWTERTINPHPPKRCLHSACFAYDIRKMVIYGGQDTGPLEDIWSLGLNNYSWQDITPSVKPQGRFWSSIIYTGGGRVVMFGGLSTNALGDMWKFSLGSNSWEQVDQGAIYPPARWGHTAIYVPQGDRMIIFGGEGTSGYKDTWQFSSVSAIGIKPVSQNVPDEFSLGQNYPNPFNPVTKIEFQIAVRTITTIKIFDVVGKEISILVNEEVSPGTYEVEWDGSDFSSGIYYYTLKTDNYSETRKMVLLK